MKSFSLQNKIKTSILAWSVLVGLLISLVIGWQYFNAVLTCSDAISDLECNKKLSPLFFPFPYGLAYGLFFWILISFIVLSLIKYFKNKR